VPGGILVELDGFDAAGQLVSQDAVLVGSSTIPAAGGLTPRKLSLVPPITAKPIRFIALYVVSAIRTIPLDTPPAVAREEPRIAFSRLVYQPKLKP
jgi:hypothetical protein